MNLHLTDPEKCHTILAPTFYAAK